MDKETLDVTKTSRRSFARSLGAAAGAIPLLSLVSIGQGCKLIEQEKPRMEQTSPITIGGGGSVAINFDEDYYKQQGQTNKFVNDKRDVMHKFRILNRFSTPTTQKDTPNPNCRLVIHCLNVSGHDSPVTIYGSPMGIEFDVKEYELERPDGALEAIRFEASRKIIGKIQYFEGAATIPTEEYAVPTGGVCTIDVLDLL